MFRRLARPVEVDAARMPNARWEPLSPDIADWMGLDEAMVPIIRDLAGLAPDPAPDQSQAPVTTA